MSRLLFDIETNPVDFSTGNFLPQIYTVHCLVIKDIDTNKIERFYDTDTLRELGSAPLEHGIKKLEKADELIGHNIIQFDIPVLEKLFGFKGSASICDTLVLSRLLYPDRPGGHSLGAYGEKLGFAKGDSPDFGQFSRDMLAYCERDVELNHRVYNLLQQERKLGDWDRAITLEHRIAEIIAEQERRGFYFNIPQAIFYVAEWTNEINAIDSDVHRHCGKRVYHGPVVQKPFKINGDYAKRTIDLGHQWGIELGSIGGPFSLFRYNDIDLNSKDKQKSILLENGWQPRSHTKTGSPKIDDSISEVPVIGGLLSRRNILTHRRSQVQGLIDIADPYSRVHGGANPCGTNTCRMKHQRIVNLPRVTSELGSEVRSLFCVPTDKVLVGYDAKALELRILAHYIGNEEYNERVTTTDKSRDAHVLAARAAGLDDRDTGKTINYALIYGAGDAKLGSIIGGGEADGAVLRRELYKSIPGLESVVTRAKQASRRGYLIGLDGRRLYTRQRVSPLNTLIQGGGSIFMKYAAAWLDADVKTDRLKAFKVVDMHDEAQWEVPPEEVELLSRKIANAFDLASEELNLRCPQEPDVKTGTTWVDTH